MFARNKDQLFRAVQPNRVDARSGDTAGTLSVREGHESPTICLVLTPFALKAVAVVVEAPAFWTCSLLHPGETRVIAITRETATRLFIQT